MAQEKPTILKDLPLILRYGLAVGSVALALGMALLLERPIPWGGIPSLPLRHRRNRLVRRAVAWCSSRLTLEPGR